MARCARAHAIYVTLTSPDHEIYRGSTLHVCVCRQLEFRKHKVCDNRSSVGFFFFRRFIFIRNDQTVHSYKSDHRLVVT